MATVCVLVAVESIAVGSIDDMPDVLPSGDGALLALRFGERALIKLAVFD